MSRVLSLVEFIFHYGTIIHPVKSSCGSSESLWLKVMCIGVGAGVSVVCASAGVSVSVGAGVGTGAGVGVSGGFFF